jgi:hypothetical protein
MRVEKNNENVYWKDLKAKVGHLAEQQLRSSQNVGLFLVI